MEEEKTKEWRLIGYNYGKFCKLWPFAKLGSSLFIIFLIRLSPLNVIGSKNGIEILYVYENKSIYTLYVFFSELITFTKNKYNRLEITIAIKILKN